jgi:hypothetical protein
MPCGADVLKEPIMSSTRSGQSLAAMSAAVKSERYMVWCGEMSEWEAVRLRGEWE